MCFFVVKQVLHHLSAAYPFKEYNCSMEMLFCFEKGAMWLDSTFQRSSQCAISFLCEQSRIWLHAYEKSAVAQLPTISLQTSAAFARKKCQITANCAKSVSIKESLPLKMHICMCMYIYTCVSMYVYVVLKWIVSWQICVASLQESVTWVYSRFHRWCNNAWEDGRITPAKRATNLCNMFFKKVWHETKVII